jgi:hypothetical protein
VEAELKQYDGNILHDLACRWWLGATTAREPSELGSAMIVLRDLQEIEERGFFIRCVTSTSHGTMG